jgi:isopenicillin N synthase-like dioxygenase
VGLQVRTRTGEWFSVPVHDDAFVINMGELMYRLTNAKWPATKHRVIAATDPSGSRFTLPTFFNVSVDTVIAPLPGVNGEPDPEFDPVMVFDWERRHIKNNYQRRQHTTAAASTEAYVAGLAD